MSNDQKREQKPKPEQTRVAPTPPERVDHQDGALQSSLQRLEEQQKALQGLLAVATQQILEKGVLSASVQQAEQRLRQNQQEPGE